jgi:alkanesulfonate monooxygenase SsuD/methylene tetrahydromethanopterin reductase-like flavin-dependent oxidoreductase (luciferase family)
VREVFVAETDAEAWKLSVGSMMGRMMSEYFLELLGNFGFKDYLKHSPEVADSDVTAEYCAKHNWIVGSPSTVAEKLEKVYEEVGGFGQILVFGFDYMENPEAWRTSLGLLQSEVLPKVRHLVPPKPRGALAAE